MVALRIAMQGEETTSQEGKTTSGSPEFTAPDSITALAAAIIAVIFIVAAVRYGRDIWGWVCSVQQGRERRAESSHTTSGIATASLSFLLLLIAIVSVIVIFLLTMLLFWGARNPNNGGVLFDDPAQVIAALSLAFTVIATLVGTYFGIKTSSDARGAAENIARTTAATVATATNTAVNAVLATQTGTHRADLVSVVSHFHNAWNASDEEKVVGFITENATIRVVSLPAKPGTYTSKEQVRGFVREYMLGPSVQSRNYRAEQTSVSWEATVFRQTGFGLIEGTAVAVFE